MKKLELVLVLIGAAAIVSCSPTSKAARSANDEVAIQQVAYMLDQKMYKMDFSRAYPMAGPSFSLNYPYFVSVIGDRVESFLPYFGRAYSVPYGGGEGLRFDAPISDYKMVRGRKDKKTVTFDARTDEDSYKFTIDVYPTGEVYLTVNAMQKQSMSFNGQMDLDAEFEVVRVAE